MVKPRYDADNDESRHAAAKIEECQKMAKKYGWELKEIEPIQGNVLKYDCIFKGETDFPSPHHETEIED